MLKSTSDAVRAICSADPSISASQVKAALAELAGEGIREMAGEPPPRAYSRRQVGELLNCSPRTVSAYVRRGLLRPIFTGRNSQRFTAIAGDSVATLLAGGAAGKEATHHV